MKRIPPPRLARPTPLLRLGRQTRIDGEQPREISEPTERARKRATRQAPEEASSQRQHGVESPAKQSDTASSSSLCDAVAPSPLSHSDGGEGWGEGAASRSSAPINTGTTIEQHPRNETLDLSAHATVDQPSPLTPTLSPEQARGRGSKAASQLETRPRFGTPSPSPPSHSDGGEGWGEGEAPRSSATISTGTVVEQPPCNETCDLSTHTTADQLRPLTPTLSPEQARGRGSKAQGSSDAAQLETKSAPGSEKEKQYAELHCL